MNIINGSTSADTLIGTEEGDAIYPMGGADTVDAKAGDDTIYLHVGDGALSWGANYDGGAGFDTVDASAATKNVRIVSSGTPTFGFPVTNVSNVEHVVTGDGADIVAMFSATGSITIETGGGNDILMGGSGNDILDGGAGKDTAAYFSMYRAATISGQSDTRTVESPIGGKDTLKSIEYVAFKDGMLISDPDSTAGQTVRVYKALLGRDPNSAELDNAVRDRAHGTTIETSVAELTKSVDVFGIHTQASNGDFVDGLYSGLLGRVGDNAGREFWTSTIENGGSRAAVIVGFLESAEYKALTVNQMTAGYFVTDEASKYVAALYDAMAERLPDEHGFTYWVAKLKTGMLTEDGVAKAFAESHEWHSLTDGLSNADLVDYMYETALHRSADPEGRSYWLSAVNGGMSHADLIKDFAMAQEHLALIAPNITGGINFVSDPLTGF